MMLVPRKRDFDLIDDMFDDPFFTRNDNKMMKTDIKENDNNFELEVDLPGFNKDNIKMTIDDGYLTINAKQETNNDVCKKLEDLFFFYVNAKDEETLVYNEYYYKLGFADAMKMKNEIVEIER